jgi:hypothetical protein
MSTFELIIRTRNGRTLVSQHASEEDAMQALSEYEVSAGDVDPTFSIREEAQP